MQLLIGMECNKIKLLKEIYELIRISNNPRASNSVSVSIVFNDENWIRYNYYLKMWIVAASSKYMTFSLNLESSLHVTCIHSNFEEAKNNAFDEFVKSVTYDR